MKYITKNYKPEIWHTINWDTLIYNDRFELYKYSYKVKTGFSYAQELWGTPNTLNTFRLEQNIDL